ncbi:MAG TPA: HIT domain-containing protein [Bryobacteraceae bacterium]|jgi:ATP adenylyltransferase|nr:HIT domain-containing protein [Bryobacteraceae bacterium]
MDYLWSPWRYQYVQKKLPDTGCVFCHPEKFVVYRGQLNFVLLNLYPYTTGHLMIVPYEHIGTLQAASSETLQEMILLAQQAQRHLADIYKPDGFNLGMNLGESAGAGIADHIHLHVLPRWSGDTSFITTLSETRVLPEDLSVTHQKLTTAFTSAPKRVTEPRP